MTGDKDLLSDPDLRTWLAARGIQVLTPAEDATTSQPGSSPVSVVAIAADPHLAAVRARLDSGAWEALAPSGEQWTGALDTSGPLAGLHTLTVEAVDAAGNRQDVARQVATVPPAVGTMELALAVRPGPQKRAWSRL